MSSKRSNISSSEAGPPIDGPRLDSNMTQLISNKPQHKRAGLIEMLKVEPNEQRRVPLGSFTDNNPVKGFSVEIDPDPMPEDSVMTEVMRYGTAKRYELVLHVTNHGAKAVTAKVWEL